VRRLARVHCPMVCMRSTEGTFRVEIPESALYTAELDAHELRHLVGNDLALEYIRIHDDTVIWRWFEPGLDQYYRFGTVLRSIFWMLFNAVLNSLGDEF
jgi:hypothetical protein